MAAIDIQALPAGNFSTSNWGVSSAGPFGDGTNLDLDLEIGSCDSIGFNNESHISAGNMFALSMEDTGACQQPVQNDMSIQSPAQMSAGGTMSSGGLVSVEGESGIGDEDAVDDDEGELQIQVDDPGHGQESTGGPSELDSEHIQVEADGEEEDDPDHQIDDEHEGVGGGSTGSGVGRSSGTGSRSPEWWSQMSNAMFGDESISLNMSGPMGMGMGMGLGVDLCSAGSVSASASSQFRSDSSAGSGRQTPTNQAQSSQGSQLGTMHLQSRQQHQMQQQLLQQHQMQMAHMGHGVVSMTSMSRPPAGQSMQRHSMTQAQAQPKMMNAQLASMMESSNAGGEVPLDGSWSTDGCNLFPMSLQPDSDANQMSGRAVRQGMTGMQMQRVGGGGNGSGGMMGLGMNMMGMGMNGMGMNPMGLGMSDDEMMMMMNGPRGGGNGGGGWHMQQPGGQLDMQSMMAGQQFGGMNHAHAHGPFGIGMGSMGMGMGGMGLGMGMSMSGGMGARFANGAPQFDTSGATAPMVRMSRYDKTMQMHMHAQAQAQAQAHGLDGDGLPPLGRQATGCAPAGCGVKRAKLLVRSSSMPCVPVGMNRGSSMLDGSVGGGAGPMWKQSVGMGMGMGMNMNMGMGIGMDDMKMSKWNAQGLAQMMCAPRAVGQGSASGGMPPLARSMSTSSVGSCQSAASFQSASSGSKRRFSAADAVCFDSMSMTMQPDLRSAGLTATEGASAGSGASAGGSRRRVKLMKSPTWPELVPALAAPTSLAAGSSDPPAGDNSDAEDNDAGSPDATDALAPAPKQSRRNITKSLNLEVLSRHFTQPIQAAANKLGVSARTLKKVCRTFGIDRWPYRKLQMLDRNIAHLQQTAADLPNTEKQRVAGEVSRFENLQQTLQEAPYMSITLSKPKPKSSSGLGSGHSTCPSTPIASPDSSPLPMPLGSDESPPLVA